MTRDERGGGTILTGMLAVVMVLLTLLSAVLIAWFAAVREAQRVADLAALAGASAGAWHQDACVSAHRVAKENGWPLAVCEVRGQAPHVVVEVAVSVPLRPEVIGAPKEVTRVAAAGTM